RLLSVTPAALDRETSEMKAEICGQNFTLEKMEIQRKPGVAAPKALAYLTTPWALGECSTAFEMLELPIHDRLCADPGVFDTAPGRSQCFLCRGRIRPGQHPRDPHPAAHRSPPYQRPHCPKVAPQPRRSGQRRSAGNHGSKPNPRLGRRTVARPHG